MGQLVDGIWQTGDPGPAAPDGAFQRRPSVYRNWITPDGAPGPTGEGGFAAESGRYHLYVSYACPWAHRTLILRALKGLAPHISVDVVHPDMGPMGWTFDTGFDGATGDSLHGRAFLHQVYAAADPQATTRVTVPVLWDRQRGRIVSNESADIIRMFDAAFSGITGRPAEFLPDDLRDRIEVLNDRIYRTVNNGVYRAGFAGTQRAYDSAVSELFDTLDWLDGRLSRHRYLAGDTLTEADWRLFPTLVRFDPVYVTHFRCNRSRLTDFPSLWAYARELWQMSGVADTVRLDHIRRHYYTSHESINPRRIVPVGFLPDWTLPHGRG